MKVMTNEDDPKVSPYLAAASPRNCFLPSCRLPFIESCVHGKDGNFYCSPECAEVGGKLDLSQVEKLRPKSTLPSLNKKYFPAPEAKWLVRG